MQEKKQFQQNNKKDSFTHIKHLFSTRLSQPLRSAHLRMPRHISTSFFLNSNIPTYTWYENKKALHYYCFCILYNSFLNNEASNNCVKQLCRKNLLMALISDHLNILTTSNIISPVAFTMHLQVSLRIEELAKSAIVEEKILQSKNRMIRQRNSKKLTASNSAALLDIPKAAYSSNSRCSTADTFASEILDIFSLNASTTYRWQCAYKQNIHTCKTTNNQHYNQTHTTA